MLLVLALVALSVQPTVPAGPALAVHLSDARARFARALDAAHWDRTSPAITALADELTAELVPLLETSRALAASPPLQVELVELLADLGGDALGDHLRRSPTPDPRLLLGYLERHDDPALVRAALHAGASPSALASEASRGRARTGAALLVQLLRAHPHQDTNALCAAAFRLRRAETVEVAEAAVEILRERPPDESVPACIALFAHSRVGRQRLAAALAHPASDPSSINGHLLAALLLDPTEQSAAAGRALQHLLRGSSPDGDGFAWAGLGALLGLVAPLLELDHPLVRRDLRRLSDVVGPFYWHLAPVLLRAREPGLLTRALETLRQPHTRAEYLSLALLSAGLLLPARDGAATARATALLGSLRQQIQAFSIYGTSQRQVDAWIEALERTGACRDDACLTRLLTSGADETAARAAFLLGPRALASLAAVDGDAVVRRVVLRGAPWLTTALLLVVRGCPRPLRGIRELARGDVANLRGLVLEPFVASFDRACRE